MKVAFIIHSFPAVYTTFILHEMTELMKRGHDVLIIALSARHDRTVHEDVAKYDLMSRRHVVTRRGFDFVHNKLSNALVAFHLMKANMSDYGRYFRRNAPTLAPIADLVKREKVDVIHAAFADDPASMAMVISEMTGVPFTFECHARDLFVYFPFPQDKFARASRIFTISNYNRLYLTRQLQCPADKIVIKRVPFNKDYCDALPDHPKDGNLIVSACRLHPIKGLEYAIEACALTARRRPDLRYVIIGDGPLRKGLQDKIDALGMQRNISLLGNLPNTEVLAHLRRAAFCLLPSMLAPDGDRDGIPTAMIEAMYLKTPAVSSKVSGIPELIEDGINGILAGPRDVLLLAEQMDCLLSNRALRESMGERAREKVEQVFNLEENIEVLVKGLESACVT